MSINTNNNLKAENIDEKFVLVGDLADFEDEEMNLFTVGSKQIIVSLVEDKFYAFSSICSHQYAEMINGDLDGYFVTCPLHFSEFDIRNGCPMDPPAVDPIATFDVFVENDKVYVNPEERIQK